MTRRKFLKVLAAAVVAIAAGLGGAAWAILRQTKFGALPEGEALRRILASPHFRDGEFQNIVPIHILNTNDSLAAGFIKSLFIKRVNPTPPAPIPSQRVNLHALDRKQDLIIWLGHSSFFLQLGGVRFLLDPVFSPHASPFFFAVRAFPGTNPYTAEDFPDIDCLLLSHDHWDHLDYPTVMALQGKVKQVVCGLGVGAHLRRWGFPETMIHETDWGDMLDLWPNLRIHVTTASHFSGRTLKRNQSLWAGFLLESHATAKTDTAPENRRIFFSGDGGYAPHFAEIGRRFCGVDLAVLDSGQYNERWRRVHMTPEDAVQATLDLNARYYLPAHIGKFVLAYHPWDEPFKRAVTASQGKPFGLVTPMLGQIVPIGDSIPEYPHWWEHLA